MRGFEQHGQIVKNTAYSEGIADAEYYYFYDAVGNVLAVEDDEATPPITRFEMDAFGQALPEVSPIRGQKRR